MRRLLAAWLLRATGWRVEGERPAARKYVILGVPHTSNWDLLYMLASGWQLGIRPSFMMKRSAFVGPLGWLFRRLGGVPVDRSRAGGVVQQMVEALRAADDLALMVAPEGTRRAAPYWKSGFYRIALEARVPVVLSFLDWGRRVAGVGPSFVPSGDVRRDMDGVRAFYAGKVGRYPAQCGPIRLAEEEAAVGPPERAGGL